MWCPSMNTILFFFFFYAYTEGHLKRDVSIKHSVLFGAGWTLLVGVTEFLRQFVIASNFIRLKILWEGCNTIYTIEYIDQG